MAIEDSLPKSRDLYQRLGLSKNASADEIKRHYRKLAMKWHPDKNPDNREVASENFRLISQAYECLSDDKKRREYDRYGSIPGEQRSAEATQGRTRPSFRTRNVGGFDSFDADPFGFFTFEHAQRIFESFFGTWDPFSFESDPLFGSARMMPMFRGPSLMDDFFKDDFFSDNFGGSGFHTSSFISSGVGNGGAVSKQVTIVNGKRTTRTEKTVIGADGVARRTVTEEVEDVGDDGRTHSRSMRRLEGGNSSSSKRNHPVMTSAPMKLILPTTTQQPPELTKTASSTHRRSSKSRLNDTKSPVLAPTRRESKQTTAPATSRSYVRSPEEPRFNGRNGEKRGPRRSVEAPRPIVQNQQTHGRTAEAVRTTHEGLRVSHETIRPPAEAIRSETYRSSLQQPTSSRQHESSYVMSSPLTRFRSSNLQDDVPSWVPRARSSFETAATRVDSPLPKAYQYQYARPSSFKVSPLAPMTPNPTRQPTPATHSNVTTPSVGPSRSSGRGYSHTAKPSAAAMTNATYFGSTRSSNPIAPCRTPLVGTVDVGAGVPRTKSHLHAAPYNWAAVPRPGERYTVIN